MPPDQETTQTDTASDSSPTMPSDTSETPSGAPESPVKSVDALPVNSDNSPLNEPEASPLESADSRVNPDSNGISKEFLEPSTAQTPVNEPLRKPSLARELLIKARNAIQFRKRKKLDRVMSLFLQKSKITNDEVEKFLHVSDATATRYLSELEKEGKIKQNGKTGHMVSYSRV